MEHNRVDGLVGDGQGLVWSLGEQCLCGVVELDPFAGVFCCFGCCE